MQTTTVIARDSRTALEQIARRLGPDALLLETRWHPEGVEVVAALGPEARPPVVPSSPAPKQEGDVLARFTAQVAGLGIDAALVAAMPSAGIGNLGDAWARLIAFLNDSVRIMPAPHRGNRHLCVVGGSGTGKTTVLAQLAARIRREQPDAEIGLVCGDAARLGAREQLRLLGQMLDAPVYEPAPGKGIASIAEEAGPGRRLLIDMSSDPWLAQVAADELRSALGPAEGLSVLCTLPLTAQLARHRQMISHFAGLVDGFVVTQAGETLPPGAVITALIEAGPPLAYISRSADPLGGIEAARSSALSRMIVAALSAGTSAALQ